MSASSHLGITLREYDARIRTFIPDYEEMLDAAASALHALRMTAPTVLDLGIGTGALSARCLRVRPRARVIGVDEDETILAVARRRLGRRLTGIAASFLREPLPRANAIVTSFALHHVRTMAVKRRLYRRCAASLRRGGVFVCADCFLASSAAQQRLDRDRWREHLRQRYSRIETGRYFEMWAQEDLYMRLDDELDSLSRTGLITDVVWRRSPFAVIVGTKQE